jgi:hypothetical protein
VSGIATGLIGELNAYRLRSALTSLNQQRETQEHHFYAREIEFMDGEPNSRGVWWRSEISAPSPGLTRGQVRNAPIGFCS